MQSRRRRVAFAALLLGGGATAAWTPHHYRIAKPAQRKQPIKDVGSLQWAAAAGIMAASLLFSPLPSHAAADNVQQNDQVTITLTLPRSVIQSLEDNNAGTTPTISIKIKEDALQEKSSKPPAVKTEAPKPAAEIKTEAPKPVEAPAVPVVKTEAPKPVEPQPKKDVPTTSEVKKEEPKPAAEAPKVEAPAPVVVEKKPEAPAPVVVETKPEPPKVEPPKVEPPKVEPPKVTASEVPKQEVKKEEAPKPPAAVVAPPPPVSNAVTEAPKPTPPKPAVSTDVVSKPKVQTTTKPKVEKIPWWERPALETTVQKKMDGKGNSNLVLSVGELAAASAVGVGLLVAVSGLLFKPDEGSSGQGRSGQRRSGVNGSMRTNGVNGSNFSGSNVNGASGAGSPGYNSKRPTIEYTRPSETRQEVRRIPGGTRDSGERRRPAAGNNRSNGPSWSNDFSDGGYNKKEPDPLYVQPDRKEPKTRPNAPNRRDDVRPNNAPNRRNDVRPNNVKPNNERLRRTNRSYLDDLSEGGYNSKEPW